MKFDPLLGDLVLSMATAQRQAATHRHSLDHELALLTVHGMLHLLGYDHRTPEEAKIMFAKQTEILRRPGRPENHESGRLPPRWWT